MSATITKHPHRSLFWDQLSAEALRHLARQDAIVLVPVGSTEQHGPHLPTGVDSIIVTEVCRRTGERVAAKRAVVIAPTIWCSLADHHLEFGGTFSLRLATFRALLHDLCHSLRGAGFRKIVLVNGHGGNMAALAALQQELARDLGIAIATTTYFMEGVPEIADILDDQAFVMHACEAETSMMLAIEESLVDRSRFAEADGPQFDILQSLRPSLKISRPFHEVTPSGVSGTARNATAEKGNAILEVAATVLAQQLLSGEPWQQAQPEEVR